MITDSARRVSRHTDPAINERNHREMQQRLAYCAGHPEWIDQRLRELDQEWDIERALQANASTLAFTGVVLSLLGGRKWLLLPLVVTGFLFQHALQGYCPPLPVLRRLGFRTAREIDEERFALKTLRGDFRDLPEVHNGHAEQLDQVVEAVTH
jgi:hypothetical protein